MHYLLYIAALTETLSAQPKEGSMKRSKMSRGKSRKDFRKKTGVQKVNHINPRTMRGGIRL